MSLHNLSSELLHLICEYCSGGELQDLRLTSRWLRDIANQHFFPEVVTSIERRDLANVCKIANCTTDIRNGVKCFLVQADQYDADIDGRPPSRPQWLQWRATFFANNGMKIVGMFSELQQQRSTRHRARLSEALDGFLTFAFAQMDSSFLARKFYKMFIRLSDDQALLGGPRFGFSDQDEERSTVRKSADRLFAACPNISSICINWGHTLRRNIGLSNITYLRGFAVPHSGSSDHPESSDSVIKEILPAASEAGLKIRNLAIAGAEPFFMSVSAAEGPRAGHLTPYYQVLKHVERLHLVFNGADATAEDYHQYVNNGFYFITDTFAEECLVHWLKHCQILQELRLVMPIAPYVNLKVKMKHMMGCIHLRHLTLLHLAKFQAAAEDIERCLLRHRESLQELVLADVHLSDGVWPACLSTFAGRLAQLRVAIITGPFTSLEGGNDEDMFCYLGDPLQSRLQAKKHKAEVEKYILEGNGLPPSWSEDDIELSEDKDEEGASDGTDSDSEGDLEEDEDESESDFDLHDTERVGIGRYQ